MNKNDISTAIATISYEVETRSYDLANESWQLLVFQQIEKDANMVGIEFKLDVTCSINDWYESLKRMLTNQLLNGDVRSFLYRIDVSEEKIRQIDELSVDNLCLLVLEREFRKVCIRKHFSGDS